MFLSSVRVRSSSDPGGAHGDVDVEAERALLHLGVGDAELDDRLAQQLEEALRLVGRVDIRRGDDLDERRPASVEVDECVVGARDPPRRPAHVDVLRGVLLEVRAHDPTASSPSGTVERHLPSTQRARRTGRSGSPSAGRDRSSSCAKDAPLDDAHSSALPEEHRHLDRAPVRHRQRAREREADGAGARVLRRRTSSSQRQNIFVRVFRWTWISRPMTVGSSIEALRNVVEVERALEGMAARKSRFSENCGADQLEADREALREAARDSGREALPCSAGSRARRRGTSQAGCVFAPSGKRPSVRSG